MDLFGGNTPVPDNNKRVPKGTRNKDGSFKNNPMLLQHGKYGLGKKCKNCIHLVSKQYAKTYYKCELRNNVDKKSPKSDHRVNWEACGKYQS